MKTYTVQADIEQVTDVTSVRSPGGRATADPGQYVATFADGTGVVVDPSFFTEVVEKKAEPKAEEKPPPKPSAKKK